MVRMLDDVKPEIVLVPDEDEEFGPYLELDIERLRRSKYPQMAFAYEYPMPTEDGWNGRDKPYPSKPHVKAYKWRPGLTYHPYKRRARLSNFGKDDYILGHSRMRHLCFWNEEIREMKLRGTQAKKEWSHGMG
jgi:hypothetical protein